MFSFRSSSNCQFLFILLISLLLVSHICDETNGSSSCHKSSIQIHLHNHGIHKLRYGRNALWSLPRISSERFSSIGRNTTVRWVQTSGRIVSEIVSISQRDFFVRHRIVIRLHHTSSSISTCPLRNKIYYIQHSSSSPHSPHHDCLQEPPSPRLPLNSP